MFVTGNTGTYSSHKATVRRVHSGPEGYEQLPVHTWISWLLMSPLFSILDKVLISTFAECYIKLRVCRPLSDVYM